MLRHHGNCLEGEDHEGTCSFTPETIVLEGWPKIALTDGLVPLSEPAVVTAPWAVVVDEHDCEWTEDTHDGATRCKVCDEPAASVVGTITATQPVSTGSVLAGRVAGPTANYSDDAFIYPDSPEGLEIYAAGLRRWVAWAIARARAGFT